VLADGKVIMAGGEYNWNEDENSASQLNAVELFDPISKTWSVIPPPPGWTKIGDAPCCVLPDGNFLLGSIEGKACAIYDPIKASWSGKDTERKLNETGTCDKETWTLLSDGSVLTVDCYGPPEQTERYVKGSWRLEHNTPAKLVEVDEKSNLPGEIGPAVLLPSGEVWAIGATGDTAIFTPDPDREKLGAWRVGPTFPKNKDKQQLGAKDAPACLLPNGRVLCAVGPVNGVMKDYLSPTTFFEYDPAKTATNTNSR
jgi:Kelch motif